MQSLSFIVTCATIAISSVPGVRSWAVGFYTGTGCDDQRLFDDVLYQGEGGWFSNSCLTAGMPYAHVKCTHYFNNGKNNTGCAYPLIPYPGSVYFPIGTICGFGFDDQCLLDDFTHAAGECINIAALDEQHLSSRVMTFMCYDGTPGEK